MLFECRGSFLCPPTVFTQGLCWRYFKSVNSNASKRGTVTVSQIIYCKKLVCPCICLSAALNFISWCNALTHLTWMFLRAEVTIIGCSKSNIIVLIFITVVFFPPGASLCVRSGRHKLNPIKQTHTGPSRLTRLNFTEKVAAESHKELKAEKLFIGAGWLARTDIWGLNNKFAKMEARTFKIGGRCRWSSGDESQVCRSCDGNEPGSSSAQPGNRQTRGTQMWIRRGGGEGKKLGKTPTL